MKKGFNHWYDKLLSVMLTLLGFSASTGFTSCINISAAYGGPPEEYQVKVIPSELHFPSEGGEEHVRIEAYDSWSISGYPSYTKISPLYSSGSAEINIKVNENTTNQQRSAKVSVNGNGEYYSATITIVQEGIKE